MHEMLLVLRVKLHTFLIFQWFDLTCGPKIVPDFVPTEKWPRLDPAPVAVWEDGTTYKFNVYPLCGVLKKDIA